MVKIGVLFFVTWLQLANSLYIRGTTEYLSNINNQPSKEDAAVTDSDWETYKRRLGLTNEKVELLKQQKDQKATVDLINRFIKQNQNTVDSGEASNDGPSSRTLLKMYHNLIKKYKISKSTMKTSFNFVLDNGSKKNLKRPRRKIALNMVSDMPAEKIDDLIEMFTAQHSIDDKDQESDDVDDYNEWELSSSEPSIGDKDYVYEHLYEDEEDLGVPAKSNSNSEYSSFQDLILQATRNKWHQEIEETKLHSMT